MRLPAHAIDSTPVYILPTDPAWDHDRIDEELAQAKKDGLDHPLLAYQRGETRYDINAGEEGSRPVDYLKGKPARFLLRRLTVSQYANIHARQLREYRTHGSDGNFSEIYVDCARLGLAGIEDSPVEYMAAGTETSERTLRALFDRYGSLMAAIEPIGLAVWRLSQPLTDAEKKL